MIKAEWLEKGANPRFVVTNLLTDAQELYDNFSVQRGATSEHRLKELKLGIHADRLSCGRFIVNQFRLFLCQAAYLLMLEIRQAAQGTRLAQAQVSRLRETIIKMAAKVRVSVRQVLVELAAHCPFAHDMQMIAQRLSTRKQLIFSENKSLRGLVCLNDNYRPFLRLLFLIFLTESGFLFAYFYN